MPRLLSSNATQSEHGPDLETAEANLAVLASGTGGGADTSTESELLARDALRSDRDPAAPNIEMHPVTGAFADPGHESVFAAQLFRLAYPGHVLLMVLTLGVTVLIVLVASTPDLKVAWGIGALCAVLGLAGRVVLHRQFHAVRGQRFGSRAWSALYLLGCLANLGGYALPGACSSTQKVYLIPLLGLALALSNGTLGMGFAHKMALIGVVLVAGPVIIAACGEVAHAVALCNVGATLIGAVASHMVELCLRTNYVERVQERTSGVHLAEDKRQLQARNEQLRAEKERLMYDMQSRRCPPLDDDNRSAIRRGLQATPGQASHPGQPNADPSEAERSEAGGPAPSDSPPPSLPAGAPSSTASGSVSTPPGAGYSESAHRPEIAAADALADMATTGVAEGVAEAPAAGGAGMAGAAAMAAAAGAGMAIATARGVVMASAAGAGMAAGGSVMTSAAWASGAGSVTGQRAHPSQAVDNFSVVEADSASGPKPPAQAVPAAEPEHQALEEALHRIQLAHTDVEVFKVVNSLAVALGARRTEMGTVKALHAVLLQLVRSGMSNAEACSATGASTSNFSKWRRQVQKVQLDHHLYLTANPPPASASAPAAAPAQGAAAADAPGPLDR